MNAKKRKRSQSSPPFPSVFKNKKNPKTSSGLKPDKIKPSLSRQFQTIEDGSPLPSRSKSKKNLEESSESDDQSEIELDDQSEIDSIKLFNEMKQNNIQISTITYTILINLYGNKGLFDASTNGMRKNDIPKNTVTHTHCTRKD